MSGIFRARIPERVVDGKRLGRHILHDPRSANYPAELATALISIRHQSAGLPLNQGQIGSCTANALCGALNCVPHWAEGQPTLAEPDAVKLYSEETALEGQPYPPNDPGGSGVEVCTAAKNAGILAFYQSAIGIVAALRALVPRPVILGVNWYSSFDTPDQNGLVSITPDAYVRGGHEIVADQLIVPTGLALQADQEILANLARITVGFWNSWGSGWGVGGRFYMTAATLGALFDQGADCVAPRTRPGWIAQPLPAQSALPTA